MKHLDSLELKRKIMHVLIGIIGFLILFYSFISEFAIFIILIIGIMISILCLKFKVPFFSLCLNIFEREKEKKTLPGRGVLFAVAGSLLVLKLFPRDIAFASILILTFADSVSHFIGKTFGKTKSFFDERKNIEGSISGAIVSSVFAMFIVNPILAISGALTAMFFESLIIKIQDIELDDNLIIPLSAGTIMFLIRKIFGQ